MQSVSFLYGSGSAKRLRVRVHANVRLTIWQVRRLTSTFGGNCQAGDLRLLRVGYWSEVFNRDKARSQVVEFPEKSFAVNAFVAFHLRLASRRSSISPPNITETRLVLGNFVSVSRDCRQ
jgi:hypothetical protein